MALAAVELGHEYLVLTDHSPRLTVARRPDRRPAAPAARLVAAAQRRAAATASGVLTGIEVDILDDGSLDQEDELLARLDVVVGSVHSKLRDESAADDPADAGRDRQPAPGHPRALHRTQGHRPAARQARAGARPPALRRGHGVRRRRRARQGDRDQLPAGTARPAEADAAVAVEAGCRFTIDTDAHAPGQLDWLRNGCERAVACGVEPTASSTPAGRRLVDWAASHLTGGRDATRRAPAPLPSRDPRARTSTRRATARSTMVAAWDQCEQDRQPVRRRVGRAGARSAPPTSASPATTPD